MEDRGTAILRIKLKEAAHERKKTMERDAWPGWNVESSHTNAFPILEFSNKEKFCSCYKQKKFCRHLQN
jgi:hypothetical protein